MSDLSESNAIREGLNKEAPEDYALQGMPDIDDGHPFTLKKFDEALIELYEWGVDDVILQDAETLAVKRHGRLVSVGKRPLELETVQGILNDMFKISASATLQQAIDHNFTYPVKKDRRTTYRFRVNGTATMGMFSNPVGVDLTMRSISQIPPTLEELQVPDDLANALFVRNGIVIIGGETGSGKTTLLGATMRKTLTDPMGKRILSYESPIEFDFRAIPGRTGRIAQSDVYVNLKDYAHATANALRRNPDIILLGEARDAETIRGAVQNAETGHAVYTTAHVNSVGEMLSRMAGNFSANERSRAMSGLIGSSRVLLYQELLPTVDGKRCAAREYLVMDDAIRDELYETHEDQITRTMIRLVREKGHPLFRDVEAHYRAGRITGDVYKRYEAEFKQ